MTTTMFKHGPKPTDYVIPDEDEDDQVAPPANLNDKEDNGVAEDADDDEEAVVQSMPAKRMLRATPTCHII